MPKLRSFVCIMMALLPLLAPSFGQTPPAASSQLAPAVAIPSCSKADGGPGLRWIVNAGSLHHSLAAIPMELQQRTFDSPCTFMIGKLSQEPYASWKAIATISIKSFADTGHCCKEGIGAVLYDPEAWEFTPVDEQQHPGDYACKIASLVHAQHRILIAAPATDLVGKWPDLARRTGDRYDHFVQSGVAASMARCADVYEIQAQGAEAESSRFRSYVEAIRKQVRAQNPKIIVLAGISTNPNGRTVSADQVYSSVRAVLPLVDGFWLNIPAGGAFCPQCGQPQPAVAAQLLSRIESSPP
jgi:hypothetical protein